MTADDVKMIAERAIKTFFQTLVAVIVAGEATSIYDVDWKATAGVAVLAAVLSVATSMGSWNIGPDEGPSLVGEGKPKRPKRDADPEIGD